MKCAGCKKQPPTVLLNWKSKGKPDTSYTVEFCTDCADKVYSKLDHRRKLAMHPLNKKGK